MITEEIVKAAKITMGGWINTKGIKKELGPEGAFSWRIKTKRIPLWVL